MCDIIYVRKKHHRSSDSANKEKLTLPGARHYYQYTNVICIRNRGTQNASRNTSCLHGRVEGKRIIKTRK